MSNTKNQLSDLITQLSRNKSGSLENASFIEPLIAATKTGSTAPKSPSSAPSGLRSLSVGQTEEFKSINFGKPSQNNASGSSSGTGSWSRLLAQTASGGLANVLGGGLSSIAGLGGLISDITSLFGGSSKAAPPPLALFSLPESIQQTAYIGSGAANGKAGGGIYTSSGAVKDTSSTSAPASNDSVAIAQAVKNALLTSSTLVDVIAEI